MALREAKAITWAAGASLSSWTWFGVEAPTALVLPVGMEGARLLFVGTENGADGLANASAAQDLYDMDGNRVALRIPASIPAAGARVVFWPGALHAQGWLALRAVNASDADQVQSEARAATWLHPFPTA